MSRSATKVRYVDKPPQGEPTYLAVHRAADANAGRVAAVVPVATRLLRESVARDKLRAELERNNPEGALAAFDWARWRDHLKALVQPRIAETMRAAAEGAARTTFLQKQHEYTLQGAFDLTNPEAVRQAQLIAAELVTQVTDTTMAAMRAIIVDAQARGIPLRDQASTLERILIESAGLDRNRARTLANYQARQLARGVRAEVVLRRVAELRDRLIRDRALTIARHETMVAANAGQSELWGQAEASGLMPTGLLREWIAAADRRICPICDALDGQKAKSGELFVSTYNSRTYERPPAHVACRCTLALVT